MYLNSLHIRYGLKSCSLGFLGSSSRVLAVLIYGGKQAVYRPPHDVHFCCIGHGLSSIGRVLNSSDYLVAADVRVVVGRRVCRGAAARFGAVSYTHLTIGDIAAAPPSMLRGFLGKWGLILHDFATGYDTSPVARAGDEAVIKSIGNSTKMCIRDRL